VLAERGDQVVSLIADAQRPCCCNCKAKQRAGSDFDNISAVAHRSRASSPRTVTPSARLRQAQRRARHRGQTAKRGFRIDQEAQCLRDVAGESVSSGALLQALHRQPAARPIRPAVSSTQHSPILGSTPLCCCRPERNDHRRASRGTPALPVPYPRTGRVGSRI